MPAIWRQPPIYIALGASSLNGAAILLAAAGVITLEYSIRFIAPLTLFLFVSLLMISGRGRQDVLLNRMYGGLVAGIVGLIAYDVSRLIILWTGLLPVNPFRPIEVYGLLILNANEDTAFTKTLGWGFHIWNGISFAMMYTIGFGRGRLAWALGWAMILELIMVAAYPSLFGIIAGWAFVLMGTIGHLFYGYGIDWAARRVVKW